MVRLALLASFSFLTSIGQAGVIGESRWDRDFKFGASDRLKIQIFKVVDNTSEKFYDEEVQLTGSGKAAISGQSVKISGLNMFSALASIESATRRGASGIGLETKAQIIEHNGQEVVFVHGQVKRPGIVAIKGDASVAELIAAAGGQSDGADLERVSVIYNGLTRIIDLKDAESQVMVKPGAIVRVSRGLLEGDRSIEKRFEQLGTGNPMGGRLKGD